MAVFTNADKIACAKQFYERHFQHIPGASTPWTKPQLAAAIDSINNWVDANQASFLSTLATDAPVFNSASTAQQKTLLFSYVILRKAGVI